VITFWLNFLKFVFNNSKNGKKIKRRTFRRRPIDSKCFNCFLNYFLVKFFLTLSLAIQKNDKKSIVKNVLNEKKRIKKFFFEEEELIQKMPIVSFLLFYVW
jgi:hypothetical protein